jgi:threonine/homoserine/homoserine lactone efflux protein
MDIVFFLAQVVVISCSGVMQPGPVTATVITMGTRNRYAGILMALGHGIVEFPLMVVIILGVGKFFERRSVQVSIGLAGGVFLILMAIQGLLSLKAGAGTQPKTLGGKPILAGIVLSAGNPFFLIWWATVGLALATQAAQWGLWAFGLFALTHFSMDLTWLQMLSWASFKGSALLGPRGLRIVLTTCSSALLVFGVFFIYRAVGLLLEVS